MIIKKRENKKIMDLSNLDSNHGLGSMANSYCIPPKDNSLQSTKEFTDGIFEIDKDESNDFDKLDEEEHMHCFILCYIGNEVYHLEHPNWEKVGIYKFKNEEMAIKEINDYYVKISEGNPRPVTEFFEVLPNQSFKNFNSYINRLDEKGD